MADNNNPIKYSDLVKPDNSISELIKQLDELSDSYTNALKNIKAEAIQLAAVLEKVSGATNENRDAIRKGASDADRLAKAQRDLAFAESETAKQIAELKQAQREANELNKLQVKLNQSAEGSYNRLSAQYSINKIYLNNMTKEERELTKEGKELEEQTKAIYEEMKRLQSATGKEQLNVGNYPDMTEAMAGYNDKLKELLGLNTQFGNSLLSMAQNGGGINGMFSAIGNGAKALGQSLLTLLANPVFLAIAGIAGVGVAFKFWFDYNQGLVEATRLTQQFTGKSGDDLKQFRNEVQAVADTFDKDFKETLIAANAVAQQFGISQDEALKLVKDGFVAGADANGEFLDNLKEYPAYFKEAGISASQFIAITTQANKSGIYSDKGIDTIKEGNLRIREMTTATAAALDGIGISSVQVQKDLQNGTKTTFQVMQEVSAKLGELPESSAAVGTAIADIFGGPGEDAGLQYIKTLKDIDTNLDNVKAKAGKLGELQEEQLRSQAELNNVIAGLFDMTGGTFEEMTTKAKTFLNDALIWIIKGIVDLINYFIQLYNDSILFRVIVQGIITDYQIFWNTVKSLFTYMIEQIKVIGKALHGAFTLDFDEIKQAYLEWGNNTLKLTKNIVNGTVKAVKEGSANVQKQIKPITIPMTVGDAPATGTTKTDNAPATGTTKTDNAPKKTPPKKKLTNKELEDIRKKNLELVRKYEDAQTDLETDEFEKRRKKAVAEYTRQRADLEHQLATDNQLNKEGGEAINGMIRLLDEQQRKDLLAIEQDRQAQQLSIQKDGLQLRLDAAKKGSQQELDLKNQLVENERKAALLANARKPKDQQQDVGVINAAYDEKITGNNDEYAQRQMVLFDNQQKLAASEFDLLKKSEAEKTKFKLQQEKERWKKVLEINASLANKMSDAEVNTIKNIIEKIDQEIAAVDKQPKDIYQLFGLNLGDQQKQAISDSTSFALGNLSQILDANVQLADVAVQNSQREVDAAQTRLDKEIEARNNGYANNVVAAQKEVDLAKKQQEKAQKDKEKAVKQQQALDTILQKSSLITASANIWSSLSVIPVIGVGLAVAALATMWGSFAAAKIKAAQVTKAQSESYGDGTVELLTGGSHQSGNDVDLGTKADGTRRRAEGGEYFAVVNKRSSRRFRHIIPDVINSLNRGTFADKYLGAYETSGLNFNVSGDAPDIQDLKNDVREIRDQNRRRMFTNSRGEIVETYKNLRRTYKN